MEDISNNEVVLDSIEKIAERLCRTALKGIISENRVSFAELFKRKVSHSRIVELVYRDHNNVFAGFKQECFTFLQTAEGIDFDGEESVFQVLYHEFVNNRDNYFKVIVQTVYGSEFN